MHLTLSGLPAIASQIGFIVVSALPVWVAAKIVGADYPTMLRSILSLVVGMLGLLAALALGGDGFLLLTPVVFLFSFKYILGTSFPGAVVLAVLTLAGYAAMNHVIGSGADFSSTAQIAGAISSS
jgi:hypothetical protein